jgi:hypothetical protein
MNNKKTNISIGVVILTLVVLFVVKSCISFSDEPDRQNRIEMLQMLSDEGGMDLVTKAQEIKCSNTETFYIERVYRENDILMIKGWCGNEKYIIQSSDL